MPSMSPQKFLDVATVLVVFLLSASILFAQQSTTPDGSVRSTERSATDQVSTKSDYCQSTDAISADSAKLSEENVLVAVSSILDHELVASDGSQFGGISDIVVSSDGKMAFLVVQSGDILGLGGKEFAVPITSVNLMNSTSDDTNQFLRVDKSKESMSRASVLGAIDRLELTDEQWVKRNNQFFGTDMEFSDKPLVSIRAILGRDVSSIDGEVAGNLHDLLLRFDDDKFEFAIVQHGGVLGVGETYVALPYDNLIFSQDRDLNWLISTKLDTKAIQTRQQVTPDEYPELKLQSVRTQIKASPTGPSVDLPSKQEQRAEPNADVSSS